MKKIIYALGKEINPVTASDWEPLNDHSPSDIIMCSTDYYFSPSTRTIRADIYMYSNHQERTDYYRAVVVATRRNPCHIYADDDE